MLYCLRCSHNWISRRCFSLLRQQFEMINMDQYNEIMCSKTSSCHSWEISAATKWPNQKSLRKGAPPLTFMDHQVLIMCHVDKSIIQYQSLIWFFSLTMIITSKCMALPGFTLIFIIFAHSKSRGMRNIDDSPVEPLEVIHVCRTINGYCKWFLVNCLSTRAHNISFLWVSCSCLSSMVSLAGSQLLDTVEAKCLLTTTFLQQTIYKDQF